MMAPEFCGSAGFSLKFIFACVILCVHRANLISILADFNECEGEGSGENCQQVCVNNPGSFSCACFDGFASINSTHCEGKTYVQNEDPKPRNLPMC